MTTTTEQNRAGTMDTQSTPQQSVRDAARSGARKAAAFGMGLPHPLVDGDFPADAGVMTTHPEAQAIFAQLQAEDGAPYGDSHDERARELTETGISVRRTGPGILAALYAALDPENDQG